MLPYSICYRDESEMLECTYRPFFWPFLHRVIPSAQNETEVVPVMQYNTIHIHYAYLGQIVLVNPVLCIWPQVLIHITPSVLSCNPPGKESF